MANYFTHIIWRKPPTGNGENHQQPSLEPPRVHVFYPPDNLQLPVSTTLDVDKVADILIELPKIGSFQYSLCPLQQIFCVAYQEPMVLEIENAICGK